MPKTLGGAAAPTTRRQAAPVEGKARYHHGNLAEALLDGGLHLLRTHGIGGLTLRECAKLAGVSQAAIRNHFPDKNALLAGLAAKGFQALAQRRTERETTRQATGADLVGWLHLIIENYVAFAIACPDLFRLMFAFKSLKRSEHPALDLAAHASYDALCASLDDVLKAEKIDVGDIDMAAAMLWSCMHGVAMLVIDDQYRPRAAPPVSVEARCLQLAHLLAAGWQHGPILKSAGAAADIRGLSSTKEAAPCSKSPSKASVSC